MFTPGPASSIFPKFENDAGRRAESMAAMDMIVGELAGAPVGPAEFPAAATTRQPAASAAEPAAVYDG
jgi:hypothetical protein